ncbi:MAG TPA: hypothetical protein VGK48_16205, partial [Terriglobia bacterium]
MREIALREISSVKRTSIMVFLGFVLFAGPALNAQTLKVDVVLQEVTSTVTDSDGKLVTDLQPEDFIVERDGVPQKIEHFSHGKNV